MITLSNISKKYKDKYVINNFSYSFNSNGIYFLTGRSGSGKTTLLNIISGNIDPTLGSVSYSHEIESIYKDSYYIYQDFNLIPNLTLIENIKVVLKIKKQKFDMNDILTKLKEIGLYELKDNKASRISGGERQRLSIVIALILKSKVIFLDEPTSALDDENTLNIMSYLREIAQNTLVIIATHNKSLINNEDNIIDLNNLKQSDKTEECIQNSNKKINLGFNSFYIKNKMMKKQVVRLFFEILFITCLLISLSYVIPMSNVTYSAIASKEIINGSQNVIIENPSDDLSLSNYCLNKGKSALIELKYDTKQSNINEVFIDNNLNNNEIIISNTLEEELSSETLLNKNIESLDYILNVVKVEPFKDVDHTQENHIKKYIKMNFDTYVNINQTKKTIFGNNSSYFTTNNDLEYGTCIVSTNFYENYLEGKKIGDTIQLIETKSRNTYTLDLKLAGIGEKNEISKKSLYEFCDQYEQILSYDICNLTNYKETKNLMDKIINENINYCYYDNETAIYFVAQVYDGMDLLFKILIPILLIFSIFLTIYISYNMLKQNKRSFDTLRLLGVSKKSIISICMIDEIECILASILLSIIPIIKISDYFMDKLNDYKSLFNLEELHFSFSIIEPQYLICASLFVFSIIFLISLLFNLLKNNKSTYIE